MSLTVPQIMLIRNPEADTTSSRAEGLIELAGYQTDSGAFGDQYEHAVALLTLHWQSMSDSSKMSGSGGAITGMKEGQLSINYANNFSASESALASTVYGQEYLELRGLSSGFATIRGYDEIPKQAQGYPY